MVRIALLGSRPLSRRALRVLEADSAVEVPVVVTLPPEHDGWWDGSLWHLAEELEYETIPTEDVAEVLEYDVDYLLSVQYPQILGPELLEHPSEGAINLHQAELPRYRGSNVFVHSILKAREDDHWRHGTTLHFMTEEVDAGDIIAQKFVDITEEDTSRSLYEKTENASVELLEETLPEMVSGRVRDLGTPQSEFSGPRYHFTQSDIEDKKEIEASELRDPMRETAVYDRIRAFDFPPFEPAYTVLNGRKIHLTAGRYQSGED